MRNAVAVALIVNDKLPKYILLVIDADLNKCINFTKNGVSELYEADINWLLNEYHSAIDACKANLPQKVKKYLYLQLFVVTLPQHKFFLDNQLRHKFNKCLESVATKHKEMKVLRMKHRWNYKDPTLVEVKTGLLTEAGLLAYWASIDRAIQFWENGKKKQFHDRSSEFVNKLHSLHKCMTSSSSEQHQWGKGERKLPHPSDY